MLGKLNYDVTFAATGKRLHNTIDFERGLSAITGPNEAGKSTVLELVRFALFGTKALRAPRAQYEKLSVDLGFTLRDEDFHVMRTLSNALVEEAGGKPLASGTTAVNEKIESLFGYGMTVFDIAHFCKQGDVEALTNMNGVERKKMIDRTIGMEQLDDAAGAVADDAKELRGTIKAIESVLGVKPTAPVKPAGYVPREQLEAEIASAKAPAGEARRIQAWLQAHPQQAAPEEPTTKVTETASELREYEQDREKLASHKDALHAKIAACPYPPSFSAEELDKIELEWKAHCAWLDEFQFAAKHGGEPWWVTPDQLCEWVDAWKQIGERRGLEAELALLEKHQFECPNCHHTWLRDDEKARKLRERIAGLGMKEPPVQAQDCHQLLALHKTWETWWRTHRRTVPTPAPQRGTVVFNDPLITAYRKALEVRPLKVEHDGIQIPPSRAQELRERQQYEDRLDAYEEKLSLWEALEDDRALNLARELELLGAEKTLETLQAKLPVIVEYEALLRAHKNAEINYDINVAKLERAKADLEQAEAAGAAVKTLRSKIKAYLVPSLNVAASNLVSLMTGGQRQTIKVSEDFDQIEVDGQLVETLSGSAKAVANLAIRLGLGQVLTNKVFSVFLGDEIDASFDDARADYTAAALEGLNAVIKQIVLVSHKDLSVQHQIRIG